MYDYVIVGAGSAGCVLANRLSADRAISVCVIEAGPSDWFPFIHMPGAFGMFMFDKKYDWSYWAKADPRVFGGKPIFIPRGKTLGGSSSINGMVYTRGHHSDYDRWAGLGNKGWATKTYCPISVKRRTTRAEPTNITGTRVPWPCRTASLTTRFQKSSSRPPSRPACR